MRISWENQRWPWDIHCRWFSWGSHQRTGDPTWFIPGVAYPVYWCISPFFHHHFLDPSISQVFPKLRCRRLNRGQLGRSGQTSLGSSASPHSAGLRPHGWRGFPTSVGWNVSMMSMPWDFLVSKKVAHPITKLHIIYVMDDVDLSHFSG